MDKTEELIRDIRNLTAEMMGTRLRDLGQLLPNAPRGWIDAVGARFAESEAPEVFYEPPSRSSSAEYVWSRLGHLVPFPEEPDTLRDIIESYVFADGQKARHGGVNGDQASAQALVRELVEAAKREREMLSTAVTSDRSQLASGLSNFFVLHGGRGCGKTSFLNYIVSEYQDLFDQNQVIWVWLNLSDLQRSRDERTDLLHWVYVESTRVLFRYYDPESPFYRAKTKPVKVREALHDFVAGFTSDECTSRALNERLLTLQRVCHGERGHAYVSPDMVPRVLGRRAFEAALSQGYSFLVVFDGLDLLESRSGTEEVFYRLAREVFGLMREARSAGFAAVAVTATNTLGEIAHFGPAYSFSSQPRVESRVYAAPLVRIVERRLKHLRGRSEKISLAQGWALDSRPLQLDEFRQSLAESENGYSSLEAIEESFGANRRAQMQAVQLLYLDFVRRGTPGKFYVMIESLVTGGSKVPPAFDTCGNLDDGAIVHHDRRQPPTCLYPPIFDYPYSRVSSDGNASAIPATQGALLNLRILQIVRAHEILMHESSLPLQRLNIHELSQICETLFGYSDNLVTQSVQRLEEWELLSAPIRVLPPPVGVGKYPVGLLPKSGFCLRSLVYDVAYLNLAAMRVPLASWAMKDSSPYVRCSVLERDRMSEWISTKILNSIALFRLLREMNAAQSTTFDERIGSLPPRLARTATKAREGQLGTELGMFDFIGKMSQTIPDQVNRILHSVGDPEILEGIRDSVESYCARWL